MRLGEILKSLNLTSIDQLSQEERNTYRQWEEALSGRKITDEDVKVFFDIELKSTLDKLQDSTLKTREDIFLKVKLEFLRKILSFLDSPRIEKELAEKQVQALIGQ